MLGDFNGWLLMFLCMCMCMYAPMCLCVYLPMSVSIVFVCLSVVVLVYTLQASLGGHLGEDSFILSVGCTN